MNGEDQYNFSLDLLAGHHPYCFCFLVTLLISALYPDMFAQAFNQTGDLIQLKNNISDMRLLLGQAIFWSCSPCSFKSACAGTHFGTDKGGNRQLRVSSTLSQVVLSASGERASLVLTRSASGIQGGHLSFAFRALPDERDSLFSFSDSSFL